MKKLFIAAFALVLAFFAIGCGTITEKAKEALNEKIKEAAKSSEKSLESEPETEPEEAPKPETVKDSRSWMDVDFKVEFDYSPAAGITALSGGSAATAGMDEHITIARVGGTAYRRSVSKTMEMNNLYRVEDGKVVNYLFNPKNKQALRRESNAKDLGAGVRNMFSEHLGSRPPAKTKMEKQGTETIAGVECDVYIQRTEMDEKLDGLAGLAGLLGGDKGGQLKELMKSEGSSTWWIDKNDRLVARVHTKMKMQGKESEFDRWKVTFFQTGNISPREVDYDMNQYTVTKQ